MQGINYLKSKEIFYNMFLAFCYDVNNFFISTILKSDDEILLTFKIWIDSKNKYLDVMKFIKIGEILL